MTTSNVFDLDEATTDVQIDVLIEEQDNPGWKIIPDHTLLVWQLIPDDCLIFLIPNDIIDEVGRNALKLSHGHLLGTHASNDEIGNALQYLTHAIDGVDGYKDGIWSHYLQDKTKPVEANIMNVYLTGWML